MDNEIWDDLDGDGKKTKNALSFRETGLHIKSLDYVHNDDNDDDDDFNVFTFTKCVAVIRYDKNGAYVTILFKIYFQKLKCMCVCVCVCVTWVNFHTVTFSGSY